MAASDRFTKLGEQLDQAQSNVEAGAAEDRAKLKARVDAARNSADDRAAQMRAKAQKTSEQADGQWHEIQSNWDAHIQRVRQRIEDRKAERDVKHAEREADRAEADALDAVDFAAAAIEEPEHAVLPAARARADANALVAVS